MIRKTILTWITAAVTSVMALSPISAWADTEIEWLQWFANESTGSFYQDLVDEFEAQNPGIKVKLVTQPFGKVRESIVTDNAIGVGSDVLGLNMPWTKEFLDIGILEPLDAYLSSAENAFDTANLVEAPLGKINGKSWMVPLNAFPFVMHVNRGLLNKAGFDKPAANWDELLEQATAISGLGEGISGLGMPYSSQPPSNGPILTFLPLLYANGGRIMDGTTPNFDNPKVVETLQFIKTLSDGNALAPGAASRTGGVDLEEFIAGRTGFLISPGVHAGSIANRNPEMDYELVRVPGDGSKGYRVHGWELGISAKSDHKVEAWRFINFLLSKDVNARVAMSSKALPGNLDALDIVQANADEAVAAQAVILSKDTPVEEMRLSPKAVASWSVMTEEIQALLRGDQTAKETATNVQARWLELIS